MKNKLLILSLYSDFFFRLISACQFFALPDCIDLFFCFTSLDNCSNVSPFKVLFFSSVTLHCATPSVINLPQKQGVCRTWEHKEVI